MESDRRFEKRLYLPIDRTSYEKTLAFRVGHNIHRDIAC
jgi:hypothetical protein